MQEIVADESNTQPGVKPRYVQLFEISLRNRNPYATGHSVAPSKALAKKLDRVRYDPKGANQLTTFSYNLITHCALQQEQSLLKGQMLCNVKNSRLAMSN